MISSLAKVQEGVAEDDQYRISFCLDCEVTNVPNTARLPHFQNVRDVGKRIQSASCPCLSNGADWCYDYNKRLMQYPSNFVVPRNPLLLHTLKE